MFVNGQAIGSHTGLWDSFEVEIGAVAAPGTTAELLVRVEKPAGLTAGPDSASLPGRFPLRETLAGFLPYVWGHIFGGIWQDVTLYATGATLFEDVLARSAADGRISITAVLSGPCAITLEIRDPDGRPVVAATENTESTDNRTKRFSVDSVPKNEARFELTIPHPRPWSPSAPALYEARRRVVDGDERVLRFGLRSLRAEGSTLLLNERPLYPRMALSWDWYPQALDSNPGPERVRADFARLRQLGFNGVKLCLWFPPHYYFDLADELGMLLWVELPMWLPQLSAFFRTQTPIEYARLMRQARAHPSVILYTLGCELSRAADAELLAPPYATVKAHAGDALVRDNSGSGEAYGGLLNEHAEFYDYHFYAELQHLRGLLDHFSPRWRPSSLGASANSATTTPFVTSSGFAAGVGRWEMGVGKTPNPQPLTPNSPPPTSGGPPTTPNAIRREHAGPTRLEATSSGCTRVGYGSAGPSWSVYPSARAYCTASKRWNWCGYTARSPAMS